MRPLPLFLLPLLVACVSCGDAGRAQGERVQVVDDLGRDVQIETPIRRVVTLAPSVTEVVFAAGAGDRVVGVSTADNFPPEVRSLPQFSTYPVDFEAIVGLGPDLVLASDQVNHPQQITALERLGIPSYFLSARELDDVPDLVRRVGHLLGTDDVAERAADSLEQGMEQLAAVTSATDERPVVLVLAGSDPLYAFGSESYVHDLVELAGGVSATGDVGTSTPVLSDEFVLRAKPDVIVGTDSITFTPDGLLELHPTWDVVPAVANGRVYAIDPDLIYRPGPRLLDGARVLAGMIRPSESTAASR
ncbi:MAG TPA: cobalamin-binding protein [Rhodothermales bacterium]